MNCTTRYKIVDEGKFLFIKEFQLINEYGMIEYHYFATLNEEVDLTIEKQPDIMCLLMGELHMSSLAKKTEPESD